MGVSVGGSRGEFVQVQGVDEMERLLKGLPDKLGNRALLAGMKKMARHVSNVMKRKAPVSTKAEYRTAHRHYSKGALMSRINRHRPGELKRSIGVIVGKLRPGKSPQLWVGPRFGRRAVGENDGWYFHFVEKGTVRQPPQPFIEPTFRETSSHVSRGFEKVLKQEVDKYIERHGPKYLKAGASPLMSRI